MPSYDDSKSVAVVKVELLVTADTFFAIETTFEASNVKFRVEPDLVAWALILPIEIVPYAEKLNTNLLLLSFSIVPVNVPNLSFIVNVKSDATVN